MLRRHAEALCTLMAPIDDRCWMLTPAERSRAVGELANVRAAVDWAMAANQRPLCHALLARCWLVWMHNAVMGEGIARMLRVWPVPADVPPVVQADFCLALARLNADGRCDEHWLAARRAEALYREFGNRDRLADALLLMGTIGLAVNHVAEAAAALREAEQLIDDAAPLRKRAALASTQAEHCRHAGDLPRAIAAFRRQGELYRRADAELGQYLAIGNVGVVQLQSGDLDAAIESLRASVDGLRRINAPYGREHRFGMLLLALALRGDEADVVMLGREAFDRARGSACGSLLAAALHHARGGDAPRGVVLAGYAVHAAIRANADALPIWQHARQRVCAIALASGGAGDVDHWLRAGEGLSEAQAAAIAFDCAAVPA